MGRSASQTPQERADIILALLRREEPASVLARRHGISEATLYRWRDEFLAGGHERLASAKTKGGHHTEHQRIKELETELEERNMVIGELTIANRFLKKVQDRNSTIPGAKRSAK